MSDLLRAAVGLFAAVAPAGGLSAFAVVTAGLDARTRARTAAAVTVLTFALMAAAVVSGDAILGWIDVSPESFQLAAGLAMLPLALRLIWRGEALAAAPGPPGSAGWRVTLSPLTAPLVAGPASLVAALSYGARYGEATALGSAAIVLALTAVTFACGAWLTARLRPIEMQTLGRLSGALLVVVAVELMVDGVQSV